MDLGFAALAAAGSASGPGHRDESLFAAFQQNLLSLLSHELRTPLMGVLNPLRLMDEGRPGQPFSITEMVTMARRNAEQLNRTLSTLLDLAAIEGGGFHARLREVDLKSLVATRVSAMREWTQGAGLHCVVSSAESDDAVPISPVLGDLPKLSRAVDLCLEVVTPLAQKPGPLRVSVQDAAIVFEFALDDASYGEWTRIWGEAQVGFQSRLAAPGSVFSRVVQSEQQFLARDREGLGSELWLIHELMRVHQGHMVERNERTGDRRQVRLALEFPRSSPETALSQVLASRMDGVVQDLGFFSLILVRVPKGRRPAEWAAALQSGLFRASDSVYSLKNHIALILDRCSRQDQVRVMERLARAKGGGAFEWGAASAPDETLDPAELLRLATSRVR